MSKLPAFQFYPGDWMKDPNLRRCSKAAKGVWIDAMCLMFECEDRGVFASGGKPWTREEIAGAIGGDLAENLACIEELLLKGVAVLTKLGAISNKRMVRDEEHRADNRSYQSKHRKSNKTNENSKTNVRPMSGPSSTSSSTSKQIPKTNTFAQSVPPEELAGTLPLVDASSYSISKSQVNEWSQAFPGVDVKVELKKFKAWLDANPTRKKTHKGIARAIINWLSRAQDKSHGGNGNERFGSQEKQAATIAATNEVLARIRGVDHY